MSRSSVDYIIYYTPRDRRIKSHSYVVRFVHIADDEIHATAKGIA